MTTSAGVDRDVRDLRHVIEHLLVQAPVIGANHDVGLRAQRGDVFPEAVQVLPLGPGQDDRRQARAVHGRNFRPRLVRRHLVRGIAANHRHTGRVLSSLVVGRPVHRGALQEADAHAAALDDHRRVRGGAVHAGAGVGNAQLPETRNRRAEGLRSVVHVIGIAHGVEASELERFTGRRRSVEAFVAGRALARRIIEAALQVGKPRVRLLERRGDARKGRAGIGDIHQVDVAGEHEGGAHTISVARFLQLGTRDLTLLTASAGSDKLSGRSRCWNGAGTAS